jgi:hypothetical protein
MPTDARAASPAPTAFLTASLVIRATAYVVPARRDHDGPPYYQIAAGADQAPDTVELVFVTRDPALCDRALRLEGTERRVQLQWHPAQTVRTRRTLRVLEAFR